MSTPMNPDCRDGKHRACAGDAWDEVADVATPCACPCHGEHDHVWHATIADPVMTCELCGQTQERATPTDATVGGEPQGSDGSNVPAARAGDEEAANAIAEVVMAYGQDGWLPLDLRYGIADEVLERLRSLGYARAALSVIPDADALARERETLLRQLSEAVECYDGQRQDADALRAEVERLRGERFEAVQALAWLSPNVTQDGRLSHAVRVASEALRSTEARTDALAARIAALADWHETKAEKARRFPGAGHEVEMEKAAQVHDDAARRLRALLAADDAGTSEGRACDHGRPEGVRCSLCAGDVRRSAPARVFNPRPQDLFDAPSPAPASDVEAAWKHGPFSGEWAAAIADDAATERGLAPQHRPAEGQGAGR